ncbi:hypothetical protein J7J13_04275 [bacterium]|nr:hypothetical protein [bacterium]
MLKVITISGLDGSGKSTQIKLLKKYLESRGKRVFYFHAVDFSVGNIVNVIPEFFLKHSERKNIRNLDSRRNLSAELADGNDIGSKSVTRANWLQIQLRKIALFIDIWRFKRLIKKLEKQGCDHILSDRFFYDTIINITYLESKNLKIVNCKLIENCKLKIVNFTSIYLQTSPQNIMNRDRVPDQGLEYLKDKKKLYDQYFENFPQAKIINGNRSKKEIFDEIKNLCQGNIS